MHIYVENPVQKKSSGHRHQCLPCFKFIYSMQEVATCSHLAGDDVHQACQRWNKWTWWCGRWESTSFLVEINSYTVMNYRMWVKRLAHTWVHRT